MKTIAIKERTLRKCIGVASILFGACMIVAGLQEVGVR